MKKQKLVIPSREYLMECFAYDANTGHLTWRVRPLAHFYDQRACGSWNSKYANTVAGRPCFRQNGDKSCVIVGIDHVRYVAHRLIWALVGNELQDDMVIDHINRNPHDNRLDNLRMIPFGLNVSNQKCHYDSTTRITGVFRLELKRGVRWAAVLGVGGKNISLGRHSTKGLAAVARAKAEIKHYGIEAPILSLRVNKHFLKHLH